MSMRSRGGPAGPCMHACRRHDAPRPCRDARVVDDTIMLLCRAPRSRGPANEARAGGDKWSSLVPHTPHQISYRVASLPRAFVIAFVRRHSARPPWRIGGPGSGSGRERTERKPCTHRSIDRIGVQSTHDSGCRCICNSAWHGTRPWAMCASCNVTVTTRPSGARACQFQIEHGGD